MAEQCCVDGCVTPTEEVTYFKLPVSRPLRKKWLSAINSTFKLTDDALVCSRHFLKHDYMTVRGKRRLKPKVVPRLFHNGAKEGDSHDNEHLDTPNNNGGGVECDRDPDAKVEETGAAGATVATDNKANDSQNDNVTDKVLGDSQTIDTEEQSVGKKEVNRSSIDEESKSLKTLQDEIVESFDSSSEKISAPRLEVEEFSQIKDLEDILTNYHIKQTRCCQPPPGEGASEAAPGGRDTIDLDNMVETKYVEVAVEGKDQERDEDCLMLLENVQVDVDPSLFEHEEPFQNQDLEQVDLDLESDSDVVDLGEKKDAPISLLSSSDDDDVIIEEPVFSTVEVSDATDEDDIPLQRLAKKHKKTKKKRRDPKSEAISKIISFFKFECYHCKYTTNDTADYDSHMDTHSNVLHCCEHCSYTTSSMMLLSRHKERHYRDKHREKKRYKCSLCSYTARHNMSLVYHISTHGARTAAASTRRKRC